MKRAFYIDTRENRGTLFSPPSGVDDYAAWLKQRYVNCKGRDGHNVIYHGVAQKMNEIVHAALSNDVDVLAFGPYAGAAASVLEEMSGKRITVEVLDR